MPAWEYRTIDLADLPSKIDELALLNAAGEDGWELVTITSNNVAHLRRQVADPAPPADKPAPTRPRRKTAPGGE
jgi:hypothetical protein